MKKIGILILCGFLLIINHRMQAKMFFGIGSDSTDGGRDIALDFYGNIVATGYFAGTVDFDPGTTILNLSSKGFTDIYLAKYTTESKLEWAFSIGGLSVDLPHSVFVDNVNDIYLTGYFSGTVDFDPSPSSTRILQSRGMKDAFVAKYDENGKFQWAVSFGGSQDDEGMDISVDILGTVYVTGYFAGTVDFDQSDAADAEDTFTSTNNSQDIFVVIFNESGEFQSVSVFGGPGQDVGNGVRPSNVGGFFLGGFFTQRCNFNPLGNPDTLTSAGLTDAFLLKYSYFGDLDWAFRFGSAGPDQIRPGAIEVDSKDNVYVGGDFWFNTNFNPNGTANLTSKGKGDIFVAKYDALGKYLWAIGMGGDSLDAATRVGLDTAGNVYITGWYSNSVDFDPGSGFYALVSRGRFGATDGFTAKYSKDGNFVWVNGFGCYTQGSYFQNTGLGIAVNDTGDCFVTGKFYQKCFFYTKTDADSLTSKGSSDIFLVKYKPDGTIWDDKPQPKPAISVVTPNNKKEVWVIGTTQKIEWKSTAVKKVNIKYYQYEMFWMDVVKNYPADSGYYNWLIPQYPTRNCRIRIEDADNPATMDESDSTFRIYPDIKIKITSPKGGESWLAGSKQNITWTSSGLDSIKYRIYYTENDKDYTFLSFNNNLSFPQSYKWTLPKITSDKCRVKIVETSSGDYNEFVSDSVFTIYEDSGVEDQNPRITWFYTYPEPFAGTSYLVFWRPDAGRTTIKLYNLSGSEVAEIFNGYAEAGLNTVKIELTGSECGIYYYIITSGSDRRTGRISLVK